MVIRLALIAGIGLAAELGGCASAPPAAPAGVVLNDPEFAEALSRLDSNVPAGCKTYVNAKCHSFRDAYRVQECEAYVAAINALVKQSGEGAVAICDQFAEGLSANERG
jgi:hypothetical protein